VLPVVEVNLPASQFAQVWPAAEYLPASQLEHATPSMVDLPAPQFAQAEAPVGEVFPAPHFAHAL